ncbi:MAG: trigger factor [Polyangia bacterium]|jgi:trigger factor
MQITIEDISPVEKRVDFEVPWEDVAPRLHTAYEKLRREAHLKGFRPGKVPRQVIERLYRNQVEGEVAGDLVELSIRQAVDEKQIQPVAPPSIEKLELKQNEPLRFSARIEVRAQVSPKDYSGIRVSRRPTKVTDEQVAQALEGYRRQHTAFLPVEGRELTADDDLLRVEVHGKVGEHKIKTKTVTVDLADENAGGLPGLAPRLRGVPVNASGLELRYRLGDDIAIKSLAGKEISLRVTIKEARGRKVPALDDELAKDTGEADTLEQLKAKVRDKLVEADKQRIRREMASALVKEVVRRNDFPIAPSLIDRHAETIVMRVKAQLMLAGIDVEAEGGFDQEAMKKEVRAEAEESARASVLLRAIAEREGVQVDAGDVQKRLVELANARGENVNKLKTELEHSGRIEGVRAQLLEEKALDMLLAQAKIVDEDPDSLIVTPDQVGGQRLVLTPEEAVAEARKKGGEPPGK